MCPVAAGKNGRCAEQAAIAGQRGNMTAIMLDVVDQENAAQKPVDTFGRFPFTVEVLAGLEMGAIPIVTMIAQYTGHPTVFVRKKAKEYGTCKLAEGPDIAGRRVTLVEDVITTGGAVRDATNALRAAGATVEVVVCAIDRSPAGENPLADVGLEVRPVLTKAQLDAARGA